MIEKVRLGQARQEDLQIRKYLGVGRKKMPEK
jgi:hypothetical protein